VTEQIYLSGIKLSQFRSFGELEIRLPTEPGVLVVYGSNGLGKSSLFDGLEWALTDGIDHFRDARGVDKVGNYLSRWRDNPIGRTSVGLTFSDGAVVERSIASASSTESTLGGNVSDITAYLRTEPWTRPITHLHSYLLLTHFLGQSTLSRLTHRNPSERFDILKEAAQSSQLEAIATALHGRGNTAMVRAFARISQNLEKDAERFSELLSREAILWSAAEGSGVIDNIRAYELVQRIVALVGARTADLFYDLARDAAPGEPDVAKIRRTIDSSLSGVRERQKALSIASHLIQTWLRLHTELAGLKSALVETETQLSQTAEEMVTNIETRDQLKHNLDEAMHSFAVVRKQRDQLIEMREAVRAREILSSDRQAAEAKLAEVDARTVDAVRRAERAERQVHIGRRLENEISHLDADIDRHQSELQRVQEWIRFQGIIAADIDSLSQAELAHPNIDDEIADAESSARDTGNAARSQALALEELRRTFGSISSLVASIAANLPENATDCPVCATHFDDPDSLRTKAATAAERIAPVLFAQEESLATLSRLRDVADRKLAFLLDTLGQIRAQRSDLTSSRLHAAELLESIKHIQIDNASAGETSARLAEGLERTRKLRDRKRYWVRRLEPKDGPSLLTQITRAVRERDDTLAERNRLAQALSNIATGVALSDAKLASLVLQLGTINDLAKKLAEAENAHADAASKVELARQNLDASASVVSGLTAAQSAALTRRNQLLNQQSNHERELAIVLGGWRKLELTSSEPNENIVEPIGRDLRAKERDIVSAEDLLNQLVAGRAAWANQITHRDALEELRVAVDGAPNSGRDELRQAAEHLRASRLAAAASTRETKQIAQDASIQLLTELEEFNSEFIRPLDDLMKQINQAILTDPRVGIGLHVNKRKIEQTALKEGEVPDGIGNIDPVLVHSEGQMSALAVSMLCAASLTFPWSRWRALVLDDPLQHNDGIHTSAFADLMSNLVSKRGYQILISTHDVAQAEFLQRKFAARQIPCATLSLLGTGREGVETSFSPAIVSRSITS
jgi:DNA repair protein SbcC/Rad50